MAATTSADTDSTGTGSCWRSPLSQALNGGQSLIDTWPQQFLRYPPLEDLLDDPDPLVDGSAICPPPLEEFVSKCLQSFGAEPRDRHAAIQPPKRGKHRLMPARVLVGRPSLT